MNIQDLVNWAEEKSKVCPKLKDEIKDLVHLALDEIEDGASVQNEISICMSEINELINENCN
jgi:hypothetical protein